MKIVTIIGARPQFIKSSSLSRVFVRHNNDMVNSDNNLFINEVIIHTGQHYDKKMSDIFNELEIPVPKYNLGLGNLSHGAMTGKMIEAIEGILDIEKPNYLLVYGDTNSTISGALAAVKVKVPILHVEAGLRSFNLEMPEEINRILTDRISTFLFCPTNLSFNNLKKEGFPHKLSGNTFQKVQIVGDVMYDSLIYYSKKAKSKYSLNKWNVEKHNYALATIHREENTNNFSKLKDIFENLKILTKKLKVVLPLHPRTKKILEDQNCNDLLKSINILDPLSYLETQRLVMDAKLILTDSGGLQKEAYLHGVPCVTFRNETEWNETLINNWNQLVGSDKNKFLRAIEKSTI